MDLKKFGIEGDYRRVGPPGSTGRRTISPDDTIKSWLQETAEKALEKLIAKNTQVVRGRNNRNIKVSHFIGDRGTGKWGLLLVPKSGSQYGLWYIDNRGQKGSTLNFVSINLSSQELMPVARCLEQGVANDLTFPRRKTTEVDSEAKKLVILIQNTTRIAINDIENEDNFTE